MTIPIAAVCQWQLGILHYDANQHQLSNATQQLYLEPRQHQLLLCLLQAAGQVVSRDMLIAQVWQSRIVSDSAINRAVSMLRKAFACLDQSRDYIETLPKLGYRLLVDATAVTVTPRIPRAEPPSEVQPGRSHKTAPYWVMLTLLVAVALWFIGRAPEQRLSSGTLVPHSSFNGLESQLSIDQAATSLLYQRQTEHGRSQIWLSNLSEGSHRALTPASQNSAYAAISPDGSQFAFVQFDVDGCRLMLQSIAVPAPESPASKQLHQCPADNIPLLSWQPDGKALYFRQRADKTQPYKIYQLNIASNALRQLTLAPGDYSGLGDIAVAASTQQLAVLRYLTADTTELLLLNPENAAITLAQTLPLRATTLTWFSEQILLISAGQMLYQYHLPTAKLLPLYQVADTVNSLVASTGGLYFSSTEFNADIWQSGDDEAVLRINSSRADIMPRLAHDARQLAFLTNRSGRYQLWLQQADAAERLLAELPGVPGFVRLEWSADDSQLLFSKDDAAYSVEVASGKIKQLLAAGHKVGVVNWGQHANQLLYSSWRDGDWQLWLHDLGNHTEVQLTTQGGYSGRLWQGRLYFSKYHHDGLWVKDLTNSDETLLLAKFDKINWLNWHIDQNKLYYYQPDQGIYRLDLQTEVTALHLAEPERFIRHFSARQHNTVFVRHADLQGDIYHLSLTPE